jgi:hypothetical protein
MSTVPGFGAMVSAWRILWSPRRELACLPDAEFRQAGMGLMGVAILTAMAYVVVWMFAGWVFGDAYSDLPLYPALAVWSVMVLWFCRRGIVALGRLAMPRSPALVWVVVAVVFFGVLLALGRRGDDRSIYMPAQWEWLRHRSPRFRVLILAPLWGAWSMLVAMRLHRPNHRTEPAVVAMADGVGALTTIVWLIALMALTSWWLNFRPWMPVGVTLGTLGAALGFSYVLALRAGGLCRAMLLAGNVLTQLAFWMLYQIEL